MSGVNKAILIGHMGADPETRRVASGDPVGKRASGALIDVREHKEWPR